MPFVWFQRLSFLATVTETVTGSSFGRGVSSKPQQKRKCRGGEMADTGDLKSPGRKAVRVRVPPAAPVIESGFHSETPSAQDPVAGHEASCVGRCSGDRPSGRPEPTRPWGADGCPGRSVWPEACRWRAIRCFFHSATF